MKVELIQQYHAQTHYENDPDDGNTAAFLFWSSYFSVVFVVGFSLLM